MARKIFISHSSDAGSEEREFVEKLNARLEGAGFESFFDIQDLELGDDWWNKIFLALVKDAHGGVVVLTEKALKSTFVPIEVSILLARRWMGTDFGAQFPVIPVLMKNVKREDVKQGTIGNLRLDSIQWAQGGDEDQMIKRVVGALEASFDKDKAPLTCEQLVVREIAGSLKKAGVDRDRVEQVRELDVWPAALREMREPPLEALAEDMLGDFDAACAALLGFFQVHTADQQTYLRHVLNLIAPFWVDPALAELLPRHTLDADTPQPLGIDCFDHLTVKALIARAFKRPLDKVHLYSLGPNQTTLSFDELNQQVATFVLKNDPEQDPNKRLKKAIARLEHRRRNGEPVFLHLDLANGLWLDDDTLKKLAHGFRMAQCVLRGAQATLGALTALRFLGGFTEADELMRWAAYANTSESLGG